MAHRLRSCTSVVWDSIYGPQGHCDPLLIVQMTLTGRLARADTGIRTQNIILTMDALYHWSYDGMA